MSLALMNLEEAYKDLEAQKIFDSKVIMKDKNYNNVLFEIEYIKN